MGYDSVAWQTERIRKDFKMAVKIALRLRGLDLRDIETYNRILPELSDLSWEHNGNASLAVIITDDSDPVAVAISRVHQITDLMAEVRVLEVYEELVNISEIATRTGMTERHVKSLAAGATFFPSRIARSSLYSWREVVAWVRETIGIDPDEGINYLTDSQHTELNTALQRASASDHLHE